MANKNIPLVFICDNNYVMPTIVAITSIELNKKENTNYQFIIITAGISEENKQLFSKLSDTGINIKLLPVTGDKYKAINAKTYVTTTSLYKFDLPELLKEYDKVLYLDGDIIVRGDLSDILNTDLTGLYAATVKDMYVMGDSKEHINLGLDNYFNAGIMLLNLSEMRKNNITQLLLKAKKDNASLKYMDQDAFNIVFTGKVKFLPPEYNCFADYLSKGAQPAIDRLFGKGHNLAQNWIVLHYTGRKPWNYYHFINPVWRSYYKQSVTVNKPLKYEDIRHPANYFMGVTRHYNHKIFYFGAITVKIRQNKI